MRLALLALVAAVPMIARGGSVELSQGVDVLSGDRAAWRATELTGIWTGARGAAAGGAVRELSRFGEDDLELAALGQAPVAGVIVGVEGSASPTWNFLPRWSGGLHLEHAFQGAWVASAGFRAARYQGDVGRPTPLFPSAGLEKYWGRWRAAAVATAVVLDGSWSGTGRAALDLYYGEGGRVGVTAAAGRELESLGGGRLLRTDVVGGAVLGAHPLGGRWAITWELSVLRQGELYTRTGGRLGLRLGF